LCKAKLLKENDMNIKNTGKTRRSPAKPIEAQPAPAIIDGALKNLEKISSEKPQEKRIAVSTQTMISAITNAAISYRYSLQLELATGLILFTETDGISRESKQALQKIYTQAGYDCETQYGSDYKTVRRRIDANAELFDWIGQEKVSQLIENRAEMAAINALVQHLEQYNLKGINSVLALVGKPVKQPTPPKEAPKATEQPKAEEGKQPEKTSKGKPEEAQQTSAVAELIGRAVEQGRAERGEQKRRKTDSPDVLTFSSEHVQVMVSPEASKDELMRISLELLQFAETLEIAEKSEREEPLAA
jgi:ribosomal protein L12E/L44/L45/RPP1/RPP2